MAGEAVDAAEVQLAEATPKATTAALKDQAPGLFGVSYADWGSLLAALIALWVFLGLFFWLLINIAVKMRGNDYKGTPARGPGRNVRTGPGARAAPSAPRRG